MSDFLMPAAVSCAACSLLYTGFCAGSCLQAWQVKGCQSEGRASPAEERRYGKQHVVAWRRGSPETGLAAIVAIERLEQRLARSFTADHEADKKKGTDSRNRRNDEADGQAVV